MYYYQDSMNDYYSPSRRCCHDYNDNYQDRHDKNECCNNDYDNKYDHNKKHCCVRKIEETICCYPSYYNEENKEKKKDYCYKNENKEENRCCRCSNRCFGFCGLFRRW